MLKKWIVPLAVAALSTAGYAQTQQPASPPPIKRTPLGKVDVPTLVIHGDDDQIVPFEVGGKRSADVIAGATLTVYEGGAHGLPDTDRDRLHADLLRFIRS